MTEPFALWPTPGARVSLATSLRDFASAVNDTLNPPPFPDDAARGTGTVLVLPGFAAHDITTARLREFLGRQGFIPHPWECGVNLGPLPDLLARIEDRVRTLAGTGRIALVGVSMGGIFAREIARRCPTQVSRVITLGSPVRLPVVSPLAPLAQAAAMLWDAEGLAAIARIGDAVPVPLTAIVSPDDGIVDWRSTVPEGGEGVEILEVPGAHTSMGSNPAIQRLIAERLARG